MADALGLLHFYVSTDQNSLLQMLHSVFQLGFVCCSHRFNSYCLILLRFLLGMLGVIILVFHVHAHFNFAGVINPQQHFTAFVCLTSFAETIYCCN